MSVKIVDTLWHQEYKFVYFITEHVRRITPLSTTSIIYIFFERRKMFFSYILQNAFILLYCL